MRNPVYVILRYIDSENDEMNPSVEKVFTHDIAAREYIEDMGFDEDGGPEYRNIGEAVYHYSNTEDETDRIAVFEVEIAIGESLEDIVYGKVAPREPTRGRSPVRVKTPIAKPPSPIAPVQRPVSRFTFSTSTASAPPVVQEKAKSPIRAKSPLKVAPQPAPVQRPVSRFTFSTSTTSAPTVASSSVIPSRAKSPERPKSPPRVVEKSINVVREGDNIFIYGEGTYSKRKIIKDNLGAKWDIVSKKWYIPVSKGFTEEYIRNQLQ